MLGPSPVAPDPEKFRRTEGATVIPLTKASDIAHARKLIEAPASTTFAHPVVRVRAGKNGINRNYYETTWPEYSWYPYQVVAFADVISGNTATNPNLLESSVDWSNPTAWDETRPVGFADLTVVQELGVSPVLLKLERRTDSWDFDWVSLQPINGDFTLEFSADLNSADWQPVPGDWPSQRTHWTIAASDLPNPTSFFRVRVDLPE